ncbi:MAG: DUF882 domain-containing protein [Sandaracinaceae bacterium]|nr:DUF882 domain-containing protein [Sandaracinaceae bacterium]
MRRSPQIEAGFWIAAGTAIDDADMRASIVLALVLAAAPAAAQADVTVLYPEPAPRAPLVAVPVARSSAQETAPPVPTPAEPAVTELAAVASSPIAPLQPIATPTSAPPLMPVQPALAPSVEPALTATHTAASTAGSISCPPPPVRFVRTTDGSRDASLLHLTDCQGQPSAEDLLELSILARPRTAERPTARDLAAHAGDPEYFASEIRRLDPGLLVRLRAIADRFPGHDIEITSGYRPDARETSRHRTGHALDLRVVGASLEEVHAFALGFDDSGVGLYPTSEFLHVDVRPRVTRWVDLAGPGEPANMVEVVTGRDGSAASAPPLQWPSPATPRDGVLGDGAPAPSPRRARATAAQDGASREALRDALEALEALEGLDLQVP